MIGSVIRHIRVNGLLGQGGMGAVYRGRDERLNRDVALKAIHREKRMDSRSKARFMSEERVLSQLNDPGTCQIYEFIEHEGQGFLVLEYIEGQNLLDLIRAGTDWGTKFEDRP